MERRPSSRVAHRTNEVGLDWGASGKSRPRRTRGAGLIGRVPDASVLVRSVGACGSAIAQREPGNGLTRCAAEARRRGIAVRLVEAIRAFRLAIAGLEPRWLAAVRRTVAVVGA